jgi:hypothetical protein
MVEIRIKILQFPFLVSEFIEAACCNILTPFGAHIPSCAYSSGRAEHCLGFSSPTPDKKKSNVINIPEEERHSQCRNIYLVPYFIYKTFTMCCKSLQLKSYLIEK